eukprot:1382913-Amorphochlora_amoeboformis.AAC.1
MAHYQSLDDRRPASWSLRLSMAANILLLALIGYLVARDVRVNAKSKKGDRLMVTLECTEAREQGKMPSRYTTTKVRIVPMP